MWFNRHKSLSIAIGIGLSVVLLIVFAFLPIYQNAASILTKVNSRSAELENLTNRVSILSKLDPSVLANRMTVLNKALPPKKDVLLYLNSIDGLSRELGLSFGGISISPGELTEATSSAKKISKQTSGLERLETEIKMNGSEENVYSFLKTIEEVLPLMEIKNIKISVLGEDQYSLILTLAMLWAEPAKLDSKGTITLFGDEEDKYFNQLAKYRHFDQVVEDSPREFVPTKVDPFMPYVAPLAIPQP